MQWLWTVLSPLFWLTSVLLNPWVAVSLLGAVTTAGLAFRKLKPGSSQPSRPKSPVVTVVTNQQEVVKGILQVFPIHPSNGWALSSVVNSVGVFSRTWDLLSTPSTPHGLTWKVLASAVILDSPPEVAFTRSISHRDLPLWMEGLSLPGSHLLRTSPEKDGDLIRLDFAREDEPLPLKWIWPVGVVLPFLQTVMATFSNMVGREVMNTAKPSVETLSRSWYSKPGLHYMHVVPQEPSVLPYHWSALLFTGVRDKNVCVATLVMLPRQHCSNEVTSLITSQLCALKQHVVMKNLKAYPSTHRQSRPPPLVENHAPPISRSSTTPPIQSSIQGQSSVRSRRNMSEPVISAAVRRRDSDQSVLSLIREIPPPAAPPRDSRDMRYLEMAKEKADKLVRAAQATENDGWLLVGNTKGIRVMKLLPKAGESPLNCVKGTGLVNVPAPFVMHFLKDSTYTTQLDDMLKEARVIHIVSPAVQLVHMLYKGVWPTAPRDFSVLNVSGNRDPQTWLSAAISIEDSRIPSEKGHVRGHLEAGGYVIREIPGKTDVCEVTYVAQVDLKGSIPSMVVNKIADSQPQCVNKLKGIVEPLYARLRQSEQALSEYKEKFPIAKIVMEEATEDHTAPTSQVHSNHSSHNHLPTSQAPHAHTVTPSHAPQPTHPHTITEEEADDLEVKGYQDRVSPDMEESVQTLTQAEGAGTPGLSTSSPVPIETVARETTNELQFETPRFDNNVVLNPRLLDQVNGDHEVPPTEQNEDYLEAYTPEEIPSDFENDPTIELGGGRDSYDISGDREASGSGGGYDLRDGSGSRDSSAADEGSVTREGSDSSGAREDVFVYSPSPRLELKLPPYQHPRSSSDGPLSDDSISTLSWMAQSLTTETIGYPRQGTGDVDFRTMANQTAAKVLEEVFHVSGMDLNDPMTFVDQSGGWKFSGLEKDVLMLAKKSPDSPFNCFIGKGIIDLPPQTVYDSIRNPQLRYTYDNLLKELHIVKQIEEGLYILHMQHETTQCFVKQSRDFCLLVSERSEPNKKLLIGTSIDVPECPPKPDIHRGRVLCSGWVVEPYRTDGRLCTEITYLLQVDMGGIPSSLVNFISRRQPLAVAYLREYLISTSLDLSHKEDKDTSL